MVLFWKCLIFLSWKPLHTISVLGWLMDFHKLNLHWHILKKHFNLKGLKEKSINALRKTYGVVLANVDGGFFLNLSCIPTNVANPSAMFKTDVTVKAHAVSLMNVLFCKFKQKLKSLPPQDLARPSLMKNDLGNLTKMNILPSDQKFVLSVFMDAFEQVNTD